MKKEELSYKRRMDEALGIPECCMKCEYRDCIVVIAKLLNFSVL